MSKLEEQRAAARVAWEQEQAACAPYRPLGLRQRQVARQFCRIGWDAYSQRQWLRKVYRVATVRDLTNDQAARAVCVLAAYPTHDPQWETVAPYPEAADAR